MEISLKIEKVENRGGARKGAGRKPKENGRNIRASFMLSAEANAALDRMSRESGKSKNDIIKSLLEKYGNM